MTQYYEARVLFDYDPVTSDELCLRVGENVEVRVGGGEEEEDGWLYGSDLRGLHGTFPASYVADLRPSANCSDNDGGVSLAPASFHRPGDDVEHEGFGGGSAANSVDDTAVVGPNDGEVIFATSGCSQKDSNSNSAPYHPAQDTTGAASGDQGRDYNGAVTATNSLGENLSESAPTAATLQESATTECDAASVAELEGSASSQLPEGWLSAVDENSGVVYYYTADGQSSSWTRPIAAAAVAAGLLEGSGGQKGPDGSTSAGPSSTSVGVPAAMYRAEFSSLA